MNEICPVYKGMLNPIITSYKLTMCQLLILQEYLQTLRILLTIPLLNHNGPAPTKLLLNFLCCSLYIFLEQKCLHIFITLHYFFVSGFSFHLSLNIEVSLKQALCLSRSNSQNQFHNQDLEYLSFYFQNLIL